jgi:hypothetical protein
MKIFYSLLLVMMLLSTSLFAQKAGISIGGNVHFPIGDFAEIASIGYGGSATYEHPIARNTSAMLYTGYTYFDGATEGDSWTMIPLVAGVKAYLSPKLDWYFAGLLGVNFITKDYSNIILGTGSVSSTEFAGNLNFGYELKTSEKGALDISAGYVYISGLNYIAGRVAYIFKF